jgi:hypothetical protein
MMHVRIDIVPFGDETRRYAIHDFFIANMGQAEQDKHLYFVWKTDPRETEPLPDPDLRIHHARREGAITLAIKTLRGFQ